MKIYNKRYFKEHRRIYYRVLNATLIKGRDSYKLKANEQSAMVEKKRKKGEKILKKELFVHSASFALWSIGRVMDKLGMEHKKQMKLYDSIDIKKMYAEYYNLLSTVLYTDEVQHKLYINEVYKSGYRDYLRRKSEKKKGK